MTTSEPSHDAPAGPLRYLSDQIMAELAQALIARHLLSRAQADELSSRAKLTGDKLDRLLIKDSLLPEDAVLRELSAIANIAYRPLASVIIKPEAVARLPQRAAFRYRVIPIDIRGGTLVVATATVPDLSMANSLSLLLNTQLEWVLSPQDDIARSMKHFYGLGVESVDDLIQAKATETVETEENDILSGQADPGVTKFVNQVIYEAISRDATDIHVEPFENRMRIRYRIDGVLQEVPIPKGLQKLQRSIVSCAKIMAQLNIAERRKPHDGRIKVRVGREEFDLRVSVLPTRFGETLNMRILNRKAMFIDMEHLGLAQSQLTTIQTLSDLPHGIILITGPTGSGKTTTLYAILSRLNTREVKIITVEDPVEYQMDGINQIQVHPQIGMTFAAALRSILRHDPDIILIGEIRDSETADIAVRSSLTGHLVLSTLHTNDAASAVTRLNDMGVEPYLVSSCLEGVVAQRLVRRVCPACREAHTPDAVVMDELRQSFPGRVDSAVIYKARGCPNCNFTGYRGRVAIFEIMSVDDRLRALIVRQRPSNEIRNAAVANGLITLRHDGLSKVLDGLTTIDEVIRVARRLEAIPVAGTDDPDDT